MRPSHEHGSGIGVCVAKRGLVVLDSRIGLGHLVGRRRGRSRFALPTGVPWFDRVGLDHHFYGFGVLLPRRMFHYFKLTLPFNVCFGTDLDQLAIVWAHMFGQDWVNASQAKMLRGPHESEPGGHSLNALAVCFDAYVPFVSLYFD